MKYCVVLALAACGGNGKPGGGGRTDLDGVYAIQTWDENATACDSAGSSVLDQHAERGLMIKESMFVTIPVVDFHVCTDSTECNMQLDSPTLFLPYMAERGSDADGWVSDDDGVPLDDNGVCHGEDTIATLTSTGSNTVAIRIEHRTVSGFPRDNTNHCAYDGLVAAAKQVPCMKLETLTAKRE